jgi:hypothetical protein
MLPIFFAAMFVPLWRGARRAIGWASRASCADRVVSGAGLVVHRVGALTGSIVGAFIDDE